LVVVCADPTHDCLGGREVGMKDGREGGSEGWEGGRE
jgi:hypothetical protein